MVVVAMLAGALPASAQTLEWYRPFGSPLFDEALAVAADDTGVYVGGHTKGALPGQTPGFDLDGYLRRYDHAGRVLWTRQFELTRGQSSSDSVWSVVAADSGIYIAGSADRLGPRSGFVIRFDRDGNRQWTHVFDRMGSAFSIAVHHTGIFAGGMRPGAPDTAVLARLDFHGNLIWARDVDVPADVRTWITGMAVDDRGIYAIGFLGPASVRIFDLDGNQIGQIGDGSERLSGIGVDTSGLYAAGTVSLSGSSRLQKFRRTGELVWRRQQALPPVGLELDASGLKVLYNAGDTPSVARYTRNGAFLWQGRFGERLNAVGLAVAGDDAFVVGPIRGDSESATDSYVAALSPQFPARLAGLGTLLGTPAVAVLIHDARAGSVTAHLRDAGTGTLISRIRFAAGHHPQDLAVVPDLDGNGQPELALLAVHTASGRVVTQIHDAVSGARIAEVAFPGLRPMKLLAVPEADGGAPALGVFGFSERDRVMRIQIRHALTGAAMQTVPYGPWGIDQEHALAVALPDAGRMGGATLAVASLPIPLRGGLSTPIAIREALTSTRTGEYVSPRTHTIVDVIAVQNLNGIAGAELALLDRGEIRRGIRATIRDGRTAGRIKEIYFTRTGRATALLDLDDLNGNGTREIGLLSADAGQVTDMVEIKDLDTRQAISRLWLWHQGHKTLGIDVLADVNGNGTQEVAQLQEKNGGLSVLIKDALTGEPIRRVYF